VPGGRAAGRQLGAGQLGRADDGLEQVVEVVGDSRRQRAQRLQPPRLPELPLQPGLGLLGQGALGDVAGVDHHPPAAALVGVEDAHRLEEAEAALLVADAEAEGGQRAPVREHLLEQTPSGGHLVRVDHRRHPGAGQLRLLEAEDPAAGVAHVLDDAVLADDRHQVLGIVDQRAEVLLALPQRLGHPPLLQDVAPLPKRALGDERHLGQGDLGLDHVVEDAGLHRLHRHLLVAVAGHHHHRVGGEALAGGDQLHAVAVREPQVGDHQRRHLGRDPGAGLLEPVDGGQAERLGEALEGAADQLGVSLLVLDEQDLGRWLLQSRLVPGPRR